MGISQRPVLLLQLGEQADVLNGDDGLVREGLEKGNLFVREGPRLSLRNGERSNGMSFTQHRHREVASVICCLREALAGSSCTSGMCATRRVRMARAVLLPRPGGVGNASRRASAPSGLN